MRSRTCRLFPLFLALDLDLGFDPGLRLRRMHSRDRFSRLTCVARARAQRGPEAHKDKRDGDEPERDEREDGYCHTSPVSDSFKA